MRFRIYNGNADEEIEANTHDEAMAEFLERHPEETRNAVMVRMIPDGK